MLAVASAPLQHRPVQRYEPRGGALELLRAREPDVLTVGPAGTGKTLAACYKLHFALLAYPNARALMCRKVLEDLKSGALTTYINGVKPHLAGVTQFGGNRFYPAEFRYPNGSVLQVVGLDKPGKVMSSEFDMIYLNEATELDDDESWQKLKSRLRHGKIPYQMIFGDANPSFPQHWLNLRCDARRTRRITSTHRDNPAYWDIRANDWTPLGLQYVVGILGSLTGVERSRLLDGNWVATEGLVYKAFKPDMIRTEDVDGWRIVMGVDVGGTNPTVILTAHISGDEQVHVSRELYRREMTSTDILDEIREEADRCDPDAIFIDPSAKIVIGDLERERYPAYRAENDVLEGIRQVKSMLVRGFSIDPSCTETINEFGTYAYPKKTHVDSDKPEKKNDHAMDGLRYLCMGALEPILDVGSFYATPTGAAA